MAEFNFVLRNEHWRPDLELALFQLRLGEAIENLNDSEDMFDVLVRAGVFKSKGDARKNWKHTGRAIPPASQIW